MNVQANHAKNINNMYIYITHNLGYNPYKFIIIGNSDAKQYTGYLQSCNYQGKHPTLFRMAPICGQNLAYASIG